MNGSIGSVDGMLGAQNGQGGQSIVLNGNMNMNMNVSAAGPKLLPSQVTMLLGMIPNAASYRETRLDPDRMVQLLRNLDMSRARAGSQQPAGMYGSGTVLGGGGYGYRR